MGQDDASPRPVLPFPVVGLGASAGGLEAIEAFVRQAPADGGMAYVVVQHLSPDHRSLMAELLRRHTSMPVEYAVDGQGIEKDRVYLIPPQYSLSLSEGRFRLLERNPTSHLHFPIDLFFHSLAQEQRDYAVGVVLSGTGTDGVRGLRRIKEAGGLVFVQEPESARFDGMPRAAVQTGLADRVIGPASMPAELVAIARAVQGLPAPPTESQPEAPGEAYDEILALLRRETGVDFRGYKPTMVNRRLLRRMAVSGASTLEEYLAFARRAPAELVSLERELLVSVTHFFRDPAVFAQVRRLALAPLARSAGNGDALRFWVAGCATGEEAYSLAIAAFEEARLAGRALPLKVFATDLDRHALDVASRGAYPESIAADVPPELLERYFEHQGNEYVVSRALRQAVLFAPHNLTADPPFTRLALVSCRNLLIYLEPAQQRRVLARFHYALRPGGTLLLGSSESVGDLATVFRPLDPASRLFTSTGSLPPDLLEHWSGDAASILPAPAPRRDPRSEYARLLDRVKDSLVGEYAPAGLLLDEHFALLHVFGDATPWVRLGAGESSLNVLEMLAPPARSVLSSALPRTLRREKEGLYKSVRAGHDGTGADLRIRPFAEGERRLALVTFETTVRGSASAEVVQVGGEMERQLAELQQELQQSKDSLQALVEELQTSNEELQSTNEELVSANEELQSTNEELQAVNEELHSVNAEHERKIALLTELHDDMDNLLRSTRLGTLFLDRDLAIRKFTPAVSEYVSVLDRDVGRPIEHLATQVGGPAFLADLRRVLATGEKVERPVELPTLSHVLVRALPYVDGDGVAAGVVVTFVDVTDLRQALERTQRVLDALPEQVVKLDAAGRIEMVNAAWSRFGAANGADPARVGVGVDYVGACQGTDPGASRVARKLRSLLAGDTESFLHEYPCHSPTERRYFLMHAVRLADGGAVVSHLDITARKLAELALQEHATHDALTGQLNRRGLQQHLAAEVERSRREGSPLAAVFIDCDDFKKVNDSLGHAAGDVVLSTVAHRLREALRPQDRLARIGGDEFLAVLDGTRSAEAYQIAERLRRAVGSEPVALSHGPLKLTVSLAVVPLDETTSTLEEVLGAAREGLRQSKARGKNRSSLGRGGAAAEEIAGELRDLARRMREPAFFRAVAQPIVSLPDRTTIGFELLSRGPGGAFAHPQDFFRVAVEDGILSSVDLACLRVCSAAARRVEPRGAWRHLNVYPSTLLEVPPETILTLLERSPESGRYCLELSEQQILGDPAHLRESVGALRRAGIRISVDDVGFGRSSLEGLVVLEPEIVKIDRRYVLGVASDPSKRRSFRRLLGVAQALGATVIAEGLEAQADVEALQDLGVRFGQGFLLGEPSPVPGADC